MSACVWKPVLALSLPHPERALKPNGRAHWAQKARAVKKARAVARMMMRSVMAQNGVAADDVRLRGYKLTWWYKGVCPDVDNCLASCKAYLDGCADALGVDDRVLECLGIERVHNKALAGTVRLFFDTVDDV